MIKAYKPIGFTPLSLLQLIKEQYPKYKSKKIAYAGRLDPMAEGLMIYLDNQEEKINRKYFEKLVKVYEFDILLGIQTDSYDILGIPHFSKKEGKIKTRTGTFKQKYPPYSYIRVKGKPLFWWAKNNKLENIEIPTKKIKINSFKLIKKYKINNQQFLKYLTERISKVHGDFRQEKILNSWKKILNENNQFECAKFEIECSGGTYVRGLANDMNALAISIKRLKVGDHNLDDVLSLKYEQKKNKKNNNRQNIS